MNKERERQLLQALEGRIEPVPLPLHYRLGVILVAVAMTLLLLAYLGIIGCVATGLYLHIQTAPEIFTRQQGTIGRLFLFLVPIVGGSVLLLFLIKPLFAPRPERGPSHSLDPDEEPLLFTFVERLCRAVGAPVPTRIDVNCEVNASAGFRKGLASFFGNDLVLTIGLPLTAGLTLRQLAGVLAHEFGHFAQGTAMRFSYLIRAINFWFLRVVYERDSWDESLILWSRTLDFRFALFLYIARFFVWITRNVLWVLMGIGHFFSSYLLRQMEFDADRYEARMAGSAVFAETQRSLAVLNAAMVRAQLELSDSWEEEGRLCENLPKLVAAERDQLPARVLRVIEESAAERTTGWFDSHPSDRERIQNAVREDARGLFRVEGPAEQLFSDFDTLSRTISLAYYRSILGPEVGPEHLAPIARILNRSETAEAEGKALARYLQGRLSFLRPIRVDGTEAEPAPSGGDEEPARETIRSAREEILETAPRYQERLSNYEAAENRRIAAIQASTLLDAGFRIRGEKFQLADGTPEEAKKQEAKAVARLNELAGDLAPFEELIQTRLTTTLHLLSEPDVRARLDDPEEAIRRSETLLPVARTLSASYDRHDRLGVNYIRLGTLAENLEGNQNSPILLQAVRRRMGAVRSDLRELRDRLPDLPYPFEHVEEDLTIDAYLLPRLPGREELAGTLELASRFLDRYSLLYVRVLSRLVMTAQSIESALALAPLPEIDEDADE